MKPLVTCHVCRRREVELGTCCAEPQGPRPKLAPQVLPPRLRAGWRAAIALPLLLTLVGGAAKACQAVSEARERDVYEVIFALRYAAVLDRAGLPPGDYPALDACVRIDVRRWYGCAQAVIQAGAW